MASQVEEGQNPYSDLTKDDLKWRAPSSTNVETQTFYFSAPSGHTGFVQVIHSNPVGLHYQAQFTCLVHHDEKKEESVWTSTHLDNFETQGTDFVADGLSIKLNEDLNEYTISSVVAEDSLVEIKFSRGSCEGFKIGKDGTSYYGEDPNAPWGSMRHVFWPRATVSGKLVVKGTTIELGDKTHGMYVMAIQGMKPHHAAARWNFLNFQGPTTSAVVMEFTTPPSYGSQTVSVGCVTKDDKVVAGFSDVSVEHRNAKDDDVEWPAPGAITFTMNGTGKDDNETPVKAVVKGDLPNLVDRVDVMAEIPTFVKKVAAGISGARPYIYQYSNRLDLELTVGDSTTNEQGHAFSEATFIS